MKPADIALLFQRNGVSLILKVHCCLEMGDCPKIDLYSGTVDSPSKCPLVINDFQMNLAVVMLVKLANWVEGEVKAKLEGGLKMKRVKMVM